MLPKPNFLNILTPFICEWVNNLSQLHMHEEYPAVEVQIVDMLHDPIFDLYELNISDGVHCITVNLDTTLNFMVKENKIDIFDILVVRKAWGHPKTFYVELVSI